LLAVAGAVAAATLTADPAIAARDIGFAPVPGKAPPAKPKASPFAGTAGQCGVITYCGGPVISSVQIVPVYWTDQVSRSVTSWAPGYLHAIASSPLIDMLSEYSTVGKTGEVCTVPTDAGLGYFGTTTPFSTGQTIVRGSAVAAVTITPKVTTGTNIVDDNAAIGAELVAQIGHGLPAPTYDAQGYPNTLYMVFFPSSYSISIQGLGSCNGFGGYHYSGPYTPPVSCTSQYIPYAVIPDCGGGDLSGVVSHELAEAVTDTDVGPTESSQLLGDGAWYLGPSYPCSDPTSCPQNCGEVGDVCEGSGVAQIPGTQISSQNIWSQSQGGGSCDVSNPGVGPQSGPAPLSMCPVPGSGRDAGADASTGGDSGMDATTSSSGSGSTSGSGSSSGSSTSGSGSTSGSSSGTSGTSGSTSGSGSSSGDTTSSSGSSSGGSSSGSSGSFGSTSSGGSDAGDDGGFGDTGGASSGCSCEAAGSPTAGEAREFGPLVLVAGAALVAGRRRKRLNTVR
jgi:MYXO-CTERM domain-containing protein